MYGFRRGRKQAHSFISVFSRDVFFPCHGFPHAINQQAESFLKTIDPLVVKLVFGHWHKMPSRCCQRPEPIALHPRQSGVARQSSFRIIVQPVSGRRHRLRNASQNHPCEFLPRHSRNVSRQILYRHVPVSLNVAFAVVTCSGIVSNRTRNVERVSLGNYGDGLNRKNLNNDDAFTKHWQDVFPSPSKLVDDDAIIQRQSGCQFFLKPPVVKSPPLPFLWADFIS